MILVDTHVLIWSTLDSQRMGPRCRQQIANAIQNRNLAVSAFSFWEVALLERKGRIELQTDLAGWRTDLLAHGLLEIPVNGEIAIRANGLTDFHADPADRIVVATALGGHRLLTADDRILRWGGPLGRIDARS